MRDSVSVSGFVLLLGISAGCGATSAQEDPVGGASETDSGVGGNTGTGGALGSGGRTSGSGGSAGLGGTLGSGGKTSGSGGSTGLGGTLGSGGALDAGSGGTTSYKDSGPGNCPGRPTLTAGVWKDITPSGLGLPLSPPPFGIPVVEIDPSDPCTLYACVDTLGIWKTTDGGSTWARLGTPPSSPNYTHNVDYIDSPIRVLVDPNDSKHLYATQGVRGQTLGFWVSHDGGATWAWPPGFVEIVKTTTNDVTILVADPGDFNHVLIGSHSPWVGGPAGVMETKDGGQTFLAHTPGPGWSSGSLGINFLHDPVHGVGNGQTWLIGTDFGGGFWRTSDSGSTWSKVADLSIVHGGHDIYYTAAGVAYVGAQPHAARSKDNGLTWEDLSGMPGAFYYSVQGDGKSLYTQLANTGDNAGRGPQPYVTSLESDGLTWTPYQSGAQKFTDGPYLMRFDPANRIMYSANWDAGLWALKVLP
jgi:hypothetical protein